MAQADTSFVRLHDMTRQPPNFSLSLLTTSALDHQRRLWVVDLVAEAEARAGAQH